MESKLQVSNTLAVHKFVFSLIKHISDEIKTIPSFDTKKGDSELLKAIVKLVSKELQRAVDSGELTQAQANSIDKSEIIVQAMSSAFGMELTDSEKEALLTGIEFLIDNRLVKNKRIRKTMYGAIRWVLKKLV